MTAIRRIETYRCKTADRRIRSAVKETRGFVCERCRISFPADRLAVHHIFETRIYPELARDPLNMLILCAGCHSAVTAAERFAGSMLMRFYAALPRDIRERHLSYLQDRLHTAPTLLAAFRGGDVERWADRVIADLTR